MDKINSTHLSENDTPQGRTGQTSQQSAPTGARKEATWPGTAYYEQLADPDQA
ncbi:unnamed protein product [marine sediment metagenome]|uniref:Uncharacterized protein n=1 Tax=marine sediment metagenome TaxID=412755 RepID=X1GUD1_9ZZZZ